jgi:hypothetical protein
MSGRNNIIELTGPTGLFSMSFGHAFQTLNKENDDEVSLA